MPNSTVNAKSVVSVIVNSNPETQKGYLNLVGKIDEEYSMSNLVVLDTSDNHVDGVIKMINAYLEIAMHTPKPSIIKFFVPTNVAIAIRWARKSGAEVVAEKKDIDVDLLDKLLNTIEACKDLDILPLFFESSNIRYNHASCPKGKEAVLDALCNTEFEIIQTKDKNGYNVATAKGFEGIVTFDDSYWGVGGGRKYKLTKSEKYGYAIAKNVFEPVDKAGHYVPYSKLTKEQKAKFVGETGLLILALKEIEEKMPVRKATPTVTGATVKRLDLSAFGLNA